MNILLLKYNKVTNDAFRRIMEYANYSNTQVRYGNLNIFGSRIDILTYREIDEYLQNFKPFDAVMIGDIFWPTGQNICLWCKKNNVKSLFLQHGQWIYTANKQTVPCRPDSIFVYGNYAKNLIQGWETWKSVDVMASGNPRYDNCLDKNRGQYVYLAPPILKEESPSSKTIVHTQTYNWIESLNGLDKKTLLYIQPHYREADTVFLKRMFPNAVFISQQSDPLFWIERAKSVITHRNSTTVLDGIACHKKIILMNFINSNPSYFDHGFFGPFARENESYKDLLHNMLVEKSPIRWYNGKASWFVNLGNAAERIINKVRRLCQ